MILEAAMTLTKHFLLPGSLILLSFSGLAGAQVQAIDFIQLFEKMSGKQPGLRKAHARGVCAAGVFEPADSGLFVSAPLLSQGSLPVSLRFSVGGGNPAADERAPGTRGMGMQISLADGSKHTFTGNNFPVFAGKDPQTFFGFLSTLLPDEQGQRYPKRMADYVAMHPSVQGHYAWLKSAKTPASYANTEFFGLHTFFFQPKDESQIKFRWQLIPEAGVKTLEAEEAKAKPADFLAAKLAEQIATGEVSYSLVASLGEPTDSDIDPSSPWPTDRPQVLLGKVRLNSAGGDSCTAINFDPNQLSRGFTPSDDPVLKMRSPAYAISFGKRLSGQ
ncbi:catalase family peroxidase [Bowmanella sp. Y26]|nr:catalase family peroxidase [Bowmanella yangjiangensis]